MQGKEEVIFTIIVVVFLLIFLAIMLLVFLAKNNTRKNRLLFENERIKREYEDALLNTRLEIQEHTLDYVSREIHDNIGQMLSLARIQLNNIESEEYKETDELLGRAIADLRALSHNLNTNHIKDIGFNEALQNLVEQFGRSGKYHIKLQNEDSQFYIDEEKGLIIFRIIQEVLNNITKHANASEINIQLDTHAEQSEINIIDNGKGFDPAKLNGGGIGLKNMNDRIKLIGGKLNISSVLGKGTHVKILLPHEF